MPDQTSQPDNGPNPGPKWIGGLWLVSTLLALAMVYMLGFQAEPGAVTVPYSDIKAMIGTGSVIEALLTPEAITVVTVQNDEPTAYRAVMPAQGDATLLPLLERNEVEITAEAEPRGSILVYFLPWILILGVYLWLQRRMMGRMVGGLGGSGAGGLFSGRFAKPSERQPDVTFADVAGQDQAKKEVAELVEFLREPERFQRVGAEVPHGVLLMGPPGTGKTLLAKALAGEAGVPFFSTSGSEFIEVFVGVGAGRVRKMFETARETAPSVIFIDELDSIGRTRGTGLGGGHDEREQTLNQILAELDGFAGKWPVPFRVVR